MHYNETIYPEISFALAFALSGGRNLRCLQHNRHVGHVIACHVSMALNVLSNANPFSFTISRLQNYPIIAKRERERESYEKLWALSIRRDCRARARVFLSSGDISRKSRVSCNVFIRRVVEHLSIQIPLRQHIAVFVVVLTPKLSLDINLLLNGKTVMCYLGYYIIN